MSVEQISKSKLPSGHHTITFYHYTEIKRYTAEITNRANTIIDTSKEYDELEDCIAWAKEHYDYRIKF